MLRLIFRGKALIVSVINVIVQISTINRAYLDNMV